MYIISWYNNGIYNNNQCMCINCKIMSTNWMFPNKQQINIFPSKYTNVHHFSGSICKSILYIDDYQQSVSAISIITLVSVYFNKHI